MAWRGVDCSTGPFPGTVGEIRGWMLFESEHRVEWENTAPGRTHNLESNRLGGTSRYPNPGCSKAEVGRPRPEAGTFGC